jgi:hypothetical protein
MATYKVIFGLDRVIEDENGCIIKSEDLILPEKHKYFGSQHYLNELENYRDNYQDIIASRELEEIMLDRLQCAVDLKEIYPQSTVVFYNQENFFPLAVDENGFSTIYENFKIADYALSQHKELRIMFDYGTNGLWDHRGANIPYDWIPASHTVRDLLTAFAKGLDSMRIPDDVDFTSDEEKEADEYMDLGMQAAILLKNELPDWKITFHNYGQYYLLPLDEYNDSEIIVNMDFPKRKTEVENKNKLKAG